jgi:hypothetical protein
MPNSDRARMNAGTVRNSTYAGGVPCQHKPLEYSQ